MKERGDMEMRRLFRFSGIDTNKQLQPAILFEFGHTTSTLLQAQLEDILFFARPRIRSFSLSISS